MKFIKATIFQIVIIAIGLFVVKMWIAPGEAKLLFEEDVGDFLAVLGVLWFLASFVQLSTEWSVWLFNCAIGILLFMFGTGIALWGFFASLVGVGIVLGIMAWLLSPFNRVVAAVLMIIALVIGVVGWNLKGTTQPTDADARALRAEEAEIDSRTVKVNGICYSLEDAREMGLIE